MRFGSEGDEAASLINGLEAAAGALTASCICRQAWQLLVQSSRSSMGWRLQPRRPSLSGMCRSDGHMLVQPWHCPLAVLTDGVGAGVWGSQLPAPGQPKCLWGPATCLAGTCAEGTSRGLIALRHCLCEWGRLVCALSEVLATCLVGRLETAAFGLMHTSIKCFGVAREGINQLMGLAVNGVACRACCMHMSHVLVCNNQCFGFQAVHQQ